MLRPKLQHARGVHARRPWQQCGRHRRVAIVAVAIVAVVVIRRRRSSSSRRIGADSRRSWPRSGC